MRQGDPSRLKGEFAKRQRRQVFGLLPFVALLVFLSLRGFGASDAPFGIDLTGWKIGFGVYIAGYLLFTYTNWRCPACGALLGRILSFIRSCSKCGAALV
jgi:hypothetical protein